MHNPEHGKFYEAVDHLYAAGQASGLLRDALIDYCLDNCCDVPEEDFVACAIETAKIYCDDLASAPEEIKGA